MPSGYKNISLSLFIAAFSCMSFTSHASTPIDNLLLQAHELEIKTIDKISLEETIRAYERVLQEDPGHLESLNKLGHLYLLLGDGYEHRISKKKTCFMNAIKYNEQAMYKGNPAFQKEIDSGKKLWEVVDILTLNEMSPMHFWTTGIFYYYKECLGFWGQIFNYAKIKRAKIVMDRMTALDPDWGKGMLHFNWGCYYLSIPEFLGGDRDKAKMYFERSISLGPDRLIYRWGRAKYFHFKMRNPEDFRKDLEWVVSQNADNSDEPAPWKNFFQNDARLMLENFDDYYVKKRKHTVDNKIR